MKIRNGFVSNSSSSSFVIRKSALSADQLDKILNHDKVGKDLGISYSDWGWDINVTDQYVIGNTSMNNFDMDDFLSKIGVCKCNIRFGSYQYDFEESGNYFSDTCCDCSQKSSNLTEETIDAMSDTELLELKELVDKELDLRDFK